MATLREIGDAVRSPSGEDLTRVLGAVVTAAGEIRTENTNKPNHDNRIKWANLVGNAPLVMSQSIFNRLIQDTGFQNAISGGALPDAQLQAAVNGVINEFATGA